MLRNIRQICSYPIRIFSMPCIGSGFYRWMMLSGTIPPATITVIFCAVPGKQIWTGWSRIRRFFISADGQNLGRQDILTASAFCINTISSSRRNGSLSIWNDAFLFWHQERKGPVVVLVNKMNMSIKSAIKKHNRCGSSRRLCFSHYNSCEWYQHVMNYL